MKAPWNSLEVVRLSVSLLTPLVVVSVGFLFNRRIKKFEKGQWTNQKIIEKRLEVYDKLVPSLNDILCFHCYIGNWKELEPRHIVQLKRTSDKTMSIYKPLFAPAVWSAYNRFIHTCFEPSIEWGSDATIRSTFTKRAEYCETWEEEWYGFFADKFLDRVASDSAYETRQNELKMDAYAELMAAFKDSVELFEHNSVRRLRLPRKRERG